MSTPRRVLIQGAAGRDFHNFNTAFRDDPGSCVCAFTAAQIPNIAGRVYPAMLAGPRYPEGIPIFPESELDRLVAEMAVDEVVFSYSDVAHEFVMHQACRAMAAGASFRLLGPRATYLKAQVPVIAVCAVRTGSGKSQTTRRVTAILQGMGKRVVVVRHPMPYGDLSRQVAQRFASEADMVREECTIEEREEYEPHVARGITVFAGVDYGKVLERAQAEADVIVWDGGNNDLPFYAPDLLITVVDPHRAGHEVSYFPGEANLRLADVVVINKVDTATADGVARVHASIQRVAPRATVVEAASPITADKPDLIMGHKVLVIEDGPTVTHGEMAYGAGAVLARKLGAELIDPRPYLVGDLIGTFKNYPNIGPLLPAMGYGEKQVADLARTIARVPAESVVIATPVDLRRLMTIVQPCVRVSYELQELGKSDLTGIIAERLAAVAHPAAAPR